MYNVAKRILTLCPIYVMWYLVFLIERVSRQKSLVSICFKCRLSLNICSDNGYIEISLLCDCTYLL